MDLNNVRIDIEKEEKGAWVQVDPKTKLLIGSTRGTAYRKAVREETVKNSERITKLGDDSDDLIEEITAKCMAKHILLGWEGLEEGGKEIEYTEKKALELLTDPSYRQFREFISNKSDDISLFRDKSRDKVAEEVKK